MEQKWTNKLNYDEFNLICSTYYPELKKSATEKIKAQLFELGENLQKQLPGYGFKISSGENHLELPYVVLDYPKISGNNFPFLFRSVFWWGKHVSHQFFINLNSFDKEVVSALLAQLIAIKNQEPNTIFLWVGDNLWDNDISGNGFARFGTLSAGEMEDAFKRKYVKIACIQEMKKPESLFEEAIGFYKHFFSVVSAAK